MSATLIGELGLGALNPLTLSATANVSAGLSAQLSGALALQAQVAIAPPSLSVQLAALVEVVAQLQASIELGLPGIALFCAVLLALYRDSRQLETPARRAMQSVLAALALACLFNCTLYDALIGDFFCIALALVAALRPTIAPHVHTT